eukprot:g63853.t1
MSLADMVANGVDDFLIDGKRVALREEVMILMLNAEVVEVAGEKVEEVGVVLVFEIESEHDLDYLLHELLFTGEFEQLACCGVDNVG